MSLILSLLGGFRGFLSRVLRSPAVFHAFLLGKVRGNRLLFLGLRWGWVAACVLAGWRLFGPDSQSGLGALGLSFEKPWLGFMPADSSLRDVYVFLREWPWVLPFGKEAWALFKLEKVAYILVALQGILGAALLGGAAFASWNLKGLGRYLRGIAFLAFFWVIWIFLGISVSAFWIAPSLEEGLQSLLSLKGHLFHPGVFVPYLWNWQSGANQPWLRSLSVFFYIGVLVFSGPLLCRFHDLAMSLVSFLKLAAKTILRMVFWYCSILFPFYLCGAWLGFWSLDFVPWISTGLEKSWSLALPLAGQGKDFFEEMNRAYGETPVRIFLILTGAGVFWIIANLLMKRITSVLYHFLTGLDELSARLGELTDFLMSRFSDRVIRILSRKASGIASADQEGSFRFTKAHRGWSSDTGALGVLVEPEEEDESYLDEGDDEEFRSLRQAIIDSVRVSPKDEAPPEDSGEEGEPSVDGAGGGSEDGGSGEAEAEAEAEVFGDDSQPEAPPPVQTDPQADQGGSDEEAQDAQGDQAVPADPADQEGPPDPEVQEDQGSSEDPEVQEDPQGSRSPLSDGDYNPLSGEVFFEEDGLSPDFVDHIDFDEQALDEPEAHPGSQEPSFNEGDAALEDDDLKSFYNRLDRQAKARQAEREASGAADFDSLKKPSPASSPKAGSKAGAGAVAGSPVPRGAKVQVSDVRIGMIQSYADEWFRNLGANPEHAMDQPPLELSMSFDLSSAPGVSWVALRRMLRDILTGSAELRTDFRNECGSNVLLIAILSYYAESGGQEILTELFDPVDESAPAEGDEPGPSSSDDQASSGDPADQAGPGGAEAEEPEGQSEPDPEPEGSSEEELPVLSRGKALPVASFLRVRELPRGSALPLMSFLRAREPLRGSALPVVVFAKPLKAAKLPRGGALPVASFGSPLILPRGGALPPSRFFLPRSLGRGTFLPALVFLSPSPDEDAAAQRSQPDQVDQTDQADESGLVIEGGDDHGQDWDLGDGQDAEDLFAEEDPVPDIPDIPDVPDVPDVSSEEAVEEETGVDADPVEFDEPDKPGKADKDGEEDELSFDDLI